MQLGQLKRRAFITLLGSATAWPLAARAQQPAPMRLIGVLMNLAAGDAEGETRFAAFLQGLQELGWAVGRNVRIETRWGTGDVELYRTHAAELIALAPDIILASGAPAALALKRATRTIPIVFANANDAVAAGLVESLARPGGNATGFTGFEYSMSNKWLELLRQIAPGMVRTAVLRDPGTALGMASLGAIQAVAPAFGVELRPIDVHDVEEIERAVTAFAAGPNGGLIVPPSALAIVNRKPIIALAARYRLPAIYGYRSFVTDGGLISYGQDIVDRFRRAAGYVDRILKGEKPADLPVQAPTKYELVINLKTARALGIDVPPTLLAIADEVIE
jgi:putative tryptophan/tyrosine transport system substrate-binding protein